MSTFIVSCAVDDVAPAAAEQLRRRQDVPVQLRVDGRDALVGTLRFWKLAGNDLTLAVDVEPIEP